MFVNKLEKFYTYPEQLVFVDETSKDGRHAVRRYAWAKKGEKAIVSAPGERVSIFAACDTNGLYTIYHIISI